MSKRVVIVEDEFFVANHLKKILRNNGYEVIAQYHSGEDVLKDLPSLKDVVFLLDIQLSTDIDGVNIAFELKKLKIPFVFITANSEGSKFDNALTTNPVSYISKPFKEMDVLAGVTLAMQRLDKKIKIQSGKEQLILSVDEILYFKADHVYVDVYLSNGKKHSIRTQLKKLTDDLDENFCRSHKSYVVNKNKITGIKGKAISIDGLEIPLSKTYVGNFEDILE